MSKYLRVLGLCAGLIGFSSAVQLVQAEDQQASTRLMLSCNDDGTYTCGDNCRVAPYNGRGCCET